VFGARSGKSEGMKERGGGGDHAVIEIVRGMTYHVMPCTIGHALCEWMEKVLKVSVCKGNLKFAFIMSCTF
jgi:hypothetical protein